MINIWPDPHTVARAALNVASVVEGLRALKTYKLVDFLRDKAEL